VQELGLNDHSPEQAAIDTKRVLPFMEEDEKKIYDLLSDYPLHIDHITLHSKMDSATVASLLTRLELKGIIMQLPGKMFVIS